MARGPGRGLFSSPKHPHRPPDPPTTYIMVTGGFFLGRERPRREVNRSPPSSVEFEVKNEWSYTSAAPLYHHDVGRDDFTFISV